jgi:hypothetical protein
MGGTNKTILIIIIAVIFLGLGFPVFAMESRNYKITDDSLGIEDINSFSKGKSASENSELIGLASSGEIAVKSAPFKIIILAVFGLFVLTSIIILKRLKMKKI